MKTITCQFHFYENMRKATHQKIKPDEQETFKNLMVTLTKSVTDTTNNTTNTTGDSETLTILLSAVLILRIG